MTRRSLAAVLTAAALLPGALGAQAADPPAKPEFPRAGCTKRFTDPQGDAYGPPQVQHQKAPGLDVVNGYLRVTPDALQVFVEVDDVNATMPTTDPGYRYLVSFKYGSTTFTFTELHTNSSYAQANLFSGKVYPDLYPMTSPAPTGDVDFTADLMWISVSRAAFEAKSGMPLGEPGAKFENVKFWSEWALNNTQVYKSDSIEPAAAAATWVVGDDDSCFGPPPAVLSDLTVKNVQYGDATTMSAKLVSETGEALADKPLQFRVGNDAPTTATTNAAGVATATFTSKQLASATPHVVTVSFAGDEATGKTKLTGAITITQEKTAFAAAKVAKPSATARTVTATLLDDDKKPVAGVRVEFLVNGKRAATVTTNSKGQAVYKGAKAGQYVQTKLAAVPGKYLGALSTKFRV